MTDAPQVSEKPSVFHRIKPVLHGPEEPVRQEIIYLPANLSDLLGLFPSSSGQDQQVEIRTVTLTPVELVLADGSEKPVATIKDLKVTAMRQVLGESNSRVVTINVTYRITSHGWRTPGTFPGETLSPIYMALYFKDRAGGMVWGHNFSFNLECRMNNTFRTYTHHERYNLEWLNHWKTTNREVWGLATVEC
ncbi:hypothetical protein ACWGDE_11870 [Streptomyces sp. NPDC054956]